MAADEQLNEVLRVPLKQLQLVVAGQVTELPVMRKNNSLGAIPIELRNDGSLESRSRGLFSHAWVMLVKHQLFVEKYKLFTKYKLYAKYKHRWYVSS